MKKIGKIFILLILLFSFVSQVSAKTFPDLPNWAKDEIEYLSEHEVINGYPNGNFGSYDKIKRADAALMLARAKNLDLDNVPTKSKFPDVRSKDYFFKAVQAVFQSGYIKGYPNGNFGPNNYLTRAEMAQIISVAYNLEEKQGISFNDISNSWAKKQIESLAANGITTGYPDGSFKPNNTISRAEFSVMLARAMNDSFKVQPTQPSDLEVHFIDVGQGDSTLIITPEKKSILIDAGKKSAGEKVVNYLKDIGVSSIDLVVATHPDADHIGGFEDVFNNFEVKKVIDSGKEHTTQTYLNYLTLIDQKNIPFHIAKTGEYIHLDPNIKIQVLNSGDNGFEENNEASVVLKVTYNDIDFLFTGDAGVDVEELMIPRFNLESEILKVSHHGSSTGTSEAFLNKVKPKVSILSYGENSYGHPANEVINRLKAIGSNIYSTMEQGDIVVKTNGNTYTVSVNPWNPDTTPNPENIVRITNVDEVNEVVTIKNFGTIDVDMTNWTLVSVEGNQTFQFPNGFILKAGQTVSITSGPKAIDNPPAYLKWTNANIWNNSGDPAQLLNAEGEIVSEFR